MVNLTPVQKIRMVLTQYLHYILQLSGLLTFFILIIIHFTHGGITLSHSEKYIYLILAVAASLFFLVGFWVGTAAGRQQVFRIMHIPEMEMVYTNKNSIDRFFGLLILLTIYAIVFSAYLDGKYAVIHLDASRYFNDTRGYLKTASFDLNNIQFWAGQRPFTVPLFFKICSYSLSNYMDQIAMEHVSRYQAIFSIISWTTLAISFSLGMKRHFMRIIAFATILFLGASLYVTQWDRIMLSDSISTSCMILVIAFLVLAGLLWDKHRPVSAWIRGFLLVLLFLAAILFAFSRDTNAYFLAAFSGMMILGIFISAIRKHPLFPSYLAILIGFFVIFLLQNISMNTGRRYVPSLFHVIVYRVIPQQRTLDYFVAQGMPYDDRYLSLHLLDLFPLNDAAISEESVAKLYSWTGAHGKSVIAGYLLSHPLYALSAPLKDVQIWINGENILYRKILVPTSTRIHILSTVFYPIWDWLPGIFILLFCLCVGAILKDHQIESLWFVIFILFITAYPLLLLIWHSDTNDLERHAFQLALQLRLAAWMVLALLLERGVNYIVNRKVRAKSGI
jgi:hypothetical protein